MTATGSRMIRNYVHSKVGIIDDKWATVGSANLDGVSLKTSQYVIPFGILFKSEYVKLMRSIEANAVFYNGVGGQPASDLPDLMRRTLWAEHLGYPNPNHPDLTTRPPGPGGWLSLWENVAARRTAALNATPPTFDVARILRGPFYVPNTAELENGIVRVPGAMRLMSPEEVFLYRCGVEPAPHKVEDEVRSFDFNTGKWF
jgi:phosphatidylserine/phosphatidylglycerophosphate/cardiolipin synthase-like enzyme